MVLRVPLRSRGRARPRLRGRSPSHRGPRGGTLAIVASLEEDAPIDDSAALQRRREADAAAAARVPDGAPRWIRRLFAASEAFIVDRPTPDRRGSTKTVIAGYPWFGDWGRDTMISLAGLTLVTG